MNSLPVVAGNPLTTHRLLLVLGTLTVIAVLATTVVRQVSVWNLAAATPGVSPTTGCEEESFFATWRRIRGEPVFLDPSSPPFSAAYFNWLFYEAYAAVTGPFAKVYGDAAIVRFGRLFTLAGAGLGALALAFFGLRLAKERGPAVKAVVLAVAAFVFVGPLLGWWTATVRPDVWALSLEAVGLVALLVLHRRRPGLAVALAALCFFGAWSFKQSYVQALLVGVVFLLLQRRLVLAAALCGAMALGCAMALVLLGPEYRASIVDGAKTGFAFAIGVVNFGYAFVRCVPLVLLAASLLVWRPKTGPTELQADATRLAWVGLALTVSMSFLAGMKVGSGPYYYFSAMLFLAILALVSLSRSDSRWPPALFAVPTVAACCYLLFAGSLIRPREALPLDQRWALFEHAPSPRYSHEQPLNLPWLNPGAPVYLTAFNYGAYRAAGRPFTHGGIGGLIETGYFASLLLPDTTVDRYDGASLDRYERTRSADGMTLFLRKPGGAKLR